MVKPRRTARKVRTIKLPGQPLSIQTLGTKIRRLAAKLQHNKKEKKMYRERLKEVQKQLSRAKRAA